LYNLLQGKLNWVLSNLLNNPQSILLYIYLPEFISAFHKHIEGWRVRIGTSSTDGASNCAVVIRIKNNSIIVSNILFLTKIRWMLIWGKKHWSEVKRTSRHDAEKLHRFEHNNNLHFYEQNDLPTLEASRFWANNA
jgi:hypothetical protein